MKKIKLMKTIISILLLLSVTHINNVAFAQGSKVFNKPIVNGYRLDWCFRYGAECGRKVADVWCHKKMGKLDGYAKKWQQDPNIGASTHTKIISTTELCKKPGCDGFAWIECGYSLD